MKKSILMALFWVPFSFIYGQNITDALRYSRDFSHGTARFNAMSGAFSSLGGDMASIGLNPASSSVYLQNQISISSALYGQNETSLLNGVQTESNTLDINISNAGGVFVFNNMNEQSSWKKIAFGLTYNQSATYDNEIIAKGTTSSTLGNFFRSQANGFPLIDLQTSGSQSITELYAILGNTEGARAQNAFLGYQGYIIDPTMDDPTTTTYVSNTGSGVFQQEYFRYTDGYAGKFTLNASTQITNNLFLGLNINTYALEYQEASIRIERNSNQNSSIKGIQFENYLSALGDGFSFQLGGIAKINEAFRCSIYFDSPIWYTISEETSQYLETTRNVNGASVTTVVDPRIINVYDDYRLRTPSKLGAGAAYIFGGMGLISIDYSFTDYSTIRFKPGNNPYFSGQNELIQEALTGSSSLRLGSEYRWDNMSFRAGFLYEQSPFSNSDSMSDRSGFSLGLGYNGGNYLFDIGYSHSQQDVQERLLSDLNFNRDTRNNAILFTLNVNL